ncbi:MAG: type II/IV secretion system protein [Nitrosomonadales bacterium]|nr:type II/IV secretion system protein [Nitrosomonadales bacterium]
MPPDISHQLISAARAQSSKDGTRLIEVLQAMSGLADVAFVEQLAAQFHCPAMGMAQLHTLQPAFDVVSYQEALKRGCMAARDGEGAILFLFSDPFDQGLRAWGQGAVTQPVSWRLTHHADLKAFLAQQEHLVRAVDDVLLGSDSGSGNMEQPDISLRSISEDGSPVVKLVNSAMFDALKAGASDIHLECTPNGLVIKNRIDGVLNRIGEVRGRETAEQAVSRIKVMAELDIAEHRIPQDGRFKAVLESREVDFRVSIMPSIFGEDAVLRILDKKALSDELKGFSLDSLGFEAKVMKEIRRLANEPYGMLLMTGPTGSGKTTTLYAILTEINKGRDKIVTIEDPIEYQLPGILQIPVNEKKGLTFARGLRSILRHDPDKIMVGEIRDTETAHIAIQSALTGHLVFTSVHANNVFDVMSRFMHMEVDPYSFVSALNGVLAQRLVRINCRHCSEPYVPTDDELSDSGLSRAVVEQYQFERGKGCGQCRGTGFSGRKAIAEILLLNDELRGLISNRAPVEQIKEAARRNGTRMLREAALDLVAQGATTLDEINHVTFVA